MAGTIGRRHSCYHMWTLGTITGTAMAPTGHKAQRRHAGSRTNSNSPWITLAPDSEHLKWTFHYLEILLCGKSPTGQELEEKEANKGDDSNPPVSARRDTAHLNSRHLYSVPSSMRVTDEPLKAVQYQDSELCAFPTTQVVQTYCTAVGVGVNKGARLKGVSSISENQQE